MARLAWRACGCRHLWAGRGVYHRNRSQARTCSPCLSFSYLNAWVWDGRMTLGTTAVVPVDVYHTYSIASSICLSLSSSCIPLEKNPPPVLQLIMLSASNMGMSLSLRRILLGDGRGVPPRLVSLRGPHGAGEVQLGPRKVIVLPGAPVRAPAGYNG
ncbi:hypothetical protein EDB86DRAFT_2953738 [Lactarius hatsudake]|nr:hypothetical protein EDB86DRAFT_2953738 [Lactarius hatsudake]